jgi:rhodanese-related sulfurtransferase
MVAPFEVTPRQVRDRLDRGEPVRLIDVREAFEHEQARIDGADLIPMRTIPRHLDELRTETRPLVVLCHHGMRSLQVVQWLRQQGVAACSSMSGGIDQWSREIDPSVGRYF